MKLSSLTQADIRDLADDNGVYQRGKQYANAGAVSKLKVSAAKISAQVSGSSDDYKVKITQDGDELDLECDCPYSGDVCKHIIAVLITYLNVNYSPEDLTEQIPTALVQTLQNFTHSELIELILKLATDDSDIQSALIAAVPIPTQIIQQQTEKPDEVKKLKKELDRFFTNFVEEYDYDNYYNDYDEGETYDELADILETTQTLNYNDQAEIYWHMLSSSTELFGEEGPALGTPQLEEAIKRYAHAVHSLNPAELEKHDHINNLLEIISWDLFERGETEQSLKQALEIVATTQAEYRYILGELAKYNDAPLSWQGDYYLKLGDEEGYLKLRLANLSNEQDYIELAHYWQTKGDTQKYLATLESWLTGLTNETIYLRSSKNDEIFKLLSQYYQSPQDDLNLERVLQIQAKFTLNLDLYKQLKEVTTRLGTWELTKPELMKSAKRSTNILAQIYLFENDWQAAIALARSQKADEWNAGTLTVIADGIEADYPQEAIDIYDRLVEQNIERLSRTGYQAAAGYAERVKEIYLNNLKDIKGWQGYIADIRKSNARRPALQDEFKSL